MKYPNTTRSRSTRHLTVALAAAFVGLSSAPLCAQTVLASFDFQTDSAGDTAMDGLTVLFPSANILPATPDGSVTASNGSLTGNIGFVVVDNDNDLGTSGADLFGATGNNSLRLIDKNTTNSGVGVTGIRNTAAISNSALSILSFDFTTTIHTSFSNNNLLISFGKNTEIAAHSSNSADAMARVQLARLSSANGAGNVYATNSTSATGTLNSLATNSFGTNTVANVKIVVNDDSTSRTYTVGSTSRTIAANTYDVWVGDVLRNTSVGATGLAMRNSSGEGGFSYFAFGTTGSQGGHDWLIDNISVTGISAIPEPSTVASFAGLGALGMIALRRRRRVA
jgi:hypothetical protein